ncbi:uncharacterized protein Tco025E_02470 [Trypanosoma conorhini]|uniref:Dynein heavy chain coiled coil stalk domain-containing protein n=1 Tax=Trypanosoma conorhini TaxID=83891 RepID=A0A422Q3V7_9TRYP|nr:uncharacterized protein Tco025E_02470 [Trypanosoma conorhini]RNF24643.1 hypothetical protein Tco025E_02470 [Trypanosoma conorhini]
MAAIAAPTESPAPMLTEKQLAALVNIEGDVQLKAAQLSMLCCEYRTNLTRVLLCFEPLMAPLRSIIFSGVQKRKYIETQLIWLERIIVLQERRGGARKLPLSELQAVEKDLMIPVQRAMQDSYQQLDVVNKEELAVLRNYECPPDQALATMAMAMRVRGEEDTRWSTVQVVLSDSYFFTFFISRAQTLLKQPLAEEIQEELEVYCSSPDHAPEALALISVPLAAVGQWLWALRDYYRVKRIATMPDPPLSVEERRQTVTRLRYELQSIKDNMSSAAEEMQKLQDQIIRRTLEVRNEYDDTMCPLHDSLVKKTEEFIQTLEGKQPPAEEKEVEAPQQEETATSA